MPNSGKLDGVDFGYFCAQAKQRKRIANSFHITVAYPNLQIREGPGHPDPEMGGGGGGGGGCLQLPQFGVTIRRRRGGGVSPGSATASLGFYYSSKTLYM